MTNDRILVRIERLETRNRQLGKGLIATAIAITFIVGVAAAPKTQIFKNIKTQRLEIVDAKGATRALLATDTNGTVTFAMTPKSDGTRPVLLTATKAGVGTLTIGNAAKTDKSAVKLTSAVKDGCGLHVYNKKGIDVLSAADWGIKGPGIEIADKNDELRFAVGYDEDDVTDLLLQGGKNTTAAAEMCVMPDGTSYLDLDKVVAENKDGALYSGIGIHANHPKEGSWLYIDDQNGNRRVLLDYDLSNAARLQFGDEEGNLRLSIGIEKNTSAIQFIDKDGKPRLSATDDPDTGAGLTWFDQTEKIIKQIGRE